MLQVLDAAALRRWVTAAVEALRAGREEVDALNVYPVPDGDTGTNLLLTLQSVEQAVQAAGPDLAATAAAVTRGALMGARGNSGVILSQLLRGLVEALPEPGGTGADLRAGLARAADLAYAAVAAPVEGTVLTVARSAAEGATGDDLADVVRTARAAAEQALARTPEQLPVLREAGVVDAGGRGLCLVLQALEQVVTGRVVSAPPPPLVPRAPGDTAVARESGSDAYAYEVQYLLRDSDDARVAALSAALALLGDSLVVVGAGDEGGGLWNVHVHVNDVGAALEAGLDAGRPFRVTVTRFSDQVAASTPLEPARLEPAPLQPAPLQPAPLESAPLEPAPPEGRAVVAVAPSDALARLFGDGGATAVDGGPTRNPSTAEVVLAVERSGAREVVVLPNDGNVLAVARAAQAACASLDLHVAVVPTRAVVQGLAALAVFDPDVPLEQAAAAMTAAAEATRWAEVTVAVRDAATPAGPCRAGDALGLLLGEVAVVGPDLEQVAAALFDRLLAPGCELLTVLVGQGAPEGVADRLAERARAAGAEVSVFDGGQPHYPLLLGAE